MNEKKNGVTIISPSDSPEHLERVPHKLDIAGRRPYHSHSNRNLPKNKLSALCKANNFIFGSMPFRCWAIGCPINGIVCFGSRMLTKLGNIGETMCRAKIGVVDRRLMGLFTCSSSHAHLSVR